MCTPCVKWKFEATETWGLRFDNVQGSKLKEFKPIVTKAATWEPTNGLIVFDSLFPHIAFGFRNRTIPIATYHVRMLFGFSIYKMFLKYFFFIERIHRGKWLHIVNPGKSLVYVAFQSTS